VHRRLNHFNRYAEDGAVFQRVTTFTTPRAHCFFHSSKLRPIAGLLIWGALSDERTGLSFTTAVSQSYITTDGQSASLSLNKAPLWGLRHDFYYCQDSCWFVDVGRSLWREDGSIVYNCSWSSPAQSFTGPSPVELVTIFYCLRFETSLFVVSYGSQGYGGGIRPRLHTG
jgi:hypothetical protein